MTNKKFLTEVLALSLTAVLAIPAVPPVFAQEENVPSEQTTGTDSDASRGDDAASDQTGSTHSEGKLDETTAESNNNSDDESNSEAANQTGTDNEQNAENWNAGEHFVVDNVLYEVPDDSSDVNNVTVKAIALNSGSVDVVIPKTVQYDGKNYKVALSESFNAEAAQQTLESIDIQCPATILPDLSFQYCERLQSVKLPNELLSIGAGAFQYCLLLRTVILPANLETIGPNAFDYSGLRNIEVPDSVKTIKEQAFANCRRLETLTLPQNLEAITPGLFSGCTNLENVNLPASITEIGESAFAQCKSLQWFQFPENLITIGSGAFAESGLWEAILPQKLISIGDYAFSYCSDLYKVELPDNLESIGAYAFLGDFYLNFLDFPSSLKTIGKGAFSRAALMHVEWPASVTEIPEDAFLNGALSRITIPDTVTSIGENAFGNTFIKKLTIPASVTKVGDGAFSGIWNLNLIIADRSAPMEGWAYGMPFDTQGNSTLQIVGTPKTAPSWLGNYSKFYHSFLNLSNFNAPFADIDSKAWYSNVVKEAYLKDLMTGLSSWEFGPNHTMNRAMAVTVLYRMAGEPAVTGETGFKDVGKDLYYTDAVVWAVQNGIVSGYTGDKAGLFGPGDLVTREQLCTMAYRYLEHKGVNTSARAPITGFKDYRKVGAYAVEPMQFCVAKGIISGMDNGTMLAPQNYATRAQCAKILLLTSEIK